MNIKQRDINPLVVSARQNNRFHFGSVDNHARALMDLGPAFIGLPGFKDNMRWSENSSPSDVLFHCFKQFAEFAKKQDAEWKITNKNGLCIHMLIPIWMRHDAYFVSCCYLPTLFIVDRQLHDLVFYMITYFYRQQGVHLWADEIQYSNKKYDHGQTYEQLEEHLYQFEQEYRDDEQERKDELKKILLDYNHASQASQYYKKIRNNNFSLKKFKQALSVFDANNAVRKAFKSWLFMGLELMESKEQIGHYIDDSQYDMDEDAYRTGEEITPEFTVRFVWDADDNMCDHIVECLQSWQQGVGSVPYFQHVQIKKGVEFPEGLKVSDFPAKFLDFMTAGATLYTELKHKRYPTGLADLIKKKVQPVNKKKKDGRRK